MLHRTAWSGERQLLQLLASVQAAGNPVGSHAYAPGDSSTAALTAGLATAAAVTVATGATLAAADATTDDVSVTSGSSRSWFSRLTGGSSKKSKQQQQQEQQQSPAASGAAAWQQQQQQLPGLSGEPLSGAIPMLTDDGLTNHPLDYNPITNEHTAAMTMAKQAGLEAYQAGRYSEAERRFKEALCEARLGFPEGDPHIPSAMHCLAELYRNTGRYERAQELYEQAAGNLLENLGDRHWMYAAALCSLAQLHEAKGEYDTALTFLEQALQLREQLFSTSSYLYADTASHLGVVLMKKHNAAAAAAAGSSGNGSSSSSSGWFGRVKREYHDADVDRAIMLLQHAIKAVEEAGHVEETPAAAWLVELAAAHRTQQQHAAAVDCLKKAMSYMALPRKTDEQKQQEQQQQQQQQSAAGGQSSDAGSSSSSDVTSEAEDLQQQRLKLIAQAGDVSERLVEAQLACGDVAAAAATMREAVEARTVIYGRHLVVAKSMTRLANLLMQQQRQQSPSKSSSSSSDPQLLQLAHHYASSAVAIAENALQGAQRASLWSGLFKGVIRSQSASSASRSNADKAAERLMAAVQLGNACLALAAVEKLNSRPAAAESSLREAVSQLRWVLTAGDEDLQRLSQISNLEAVVFDRVAGLLVDLKLLQMDCLEALAAAIREQAAAGQRQPSSSAPPATAAASDASSSSDEIRMLLGEAELLAAELYAD